MQVVRLWHRAFWTFYHINRFKFTPRQEHVQKLKNQQVSTINFTLHFHFRIYFCTGVQYVPWQSMIWYGRLGWSLHPCAICVLHSLLVRGWGYRKRISVRGWGTREFQLKRGCRPTLLICCLQTLKRLQRLRFSSLEVQYSSIHTLTGRVSHYSWSNRTNF